MKLPAYAKPLLAARRSGTHPEFVTVIYGNDWHVAEGVTRLAVKPGEALGLDWYCVAGLPVQLVDRSQELPEEIYFLIGEIALHAATLHLTCGDVGPPGFEVSTLAHIGREWDAEKRAMRWPGWWSDELERIHGENTKRWLTEIATAVCA